MTRITTTHHLRRVVPLRPETGKATFDAVAANRVVLVRGRHRCRVTVSCGRLEFEPPVQTDASSIGPWIYRRTQGVLRRRWKPMPRHVELELSPWSGS